MLNLDNFWRENSNSNRNQCIIITKIYSFLAQKFKFAICYFSENLIFGHTFRFSNSVIYKLNKMSKPLFNKWSSELVRHKMIDCSWGCCQICLKQSWIDKCCSKTTLRLMNLFLFLLPFLRSWGLKASYPTQRI